MKLMVSGIGGVGGYIAAVLCSHDKDVTLIARGRHKEALQQKLAVHSALLGECTFHPAVTDDPASAGIQDIIFICVKNFSLCDALTAVLPCIDDHTIIVPVMNGVDHAEAARHMLTGGQVVNALIYITSSCCEDFSIRHTSPYVRVFVDAPHLETAQKVRDVLHHPNQLTCTIPADMNVELWKKYILNCAYNTITAYYVCTTRGLREDPRRLEEFRALIQEAYAVAVAQGIAIPADFPGTTFDAMMSHRNLDATSSMARDVMAHKPTELETFSGYLIRTAQALQVSVPVSERFYQALKEREMIR